MDDTAHTLDAASLSPGAHAMTPIPISVSVDEAARMVGVSRDTIYDLVNAGRLTKVKIGRRSVIKYADLQKLIEPDDKPSEEKPKAKRRIYERVG